MTDLVDFLRARLDADEQAALGAKGDTPGRWEEKADPATDIVLYDKSGKLTMGQHRHIARHDPARVLREVEAKRRVMDRHRPETNLRIRDGKYVTEGFYCPDHLDGRAWPCADVLDLAAVYADHPDYRQEWKP